jgi:hypothetical protein
MLSVLSSAGACDGHEALLSVGVHARSCLASAVGSRPSESSGILRKTLIGASRIDKNT